MLMSALFNMRFLLCVFFICIERSHMLSLFFGEFTAAVALPGPRCPEATDEDEDWSGLQDGGFGKGLPMFTYSLTH